MSLRLRINLVITLVIVAFTIAIAEIIVNDMRNSIREEIESASRVAVQLIETVVTSVYREPGPAERNQALLEFLQRVGRVRANEIRVYDQRGELLYTSPPPTYQAGRSAPEWFTQLVKPDLEASRLELPGGAIVVVPEPSRSIIEAWDDARNFVWLALGFLILINFVVFWLLDRALQPLPKILGGLAEMARGRFDVRLPAFKSTEFASLSRGFNHMAQALEESLVKDRQLEQNRKFTALVQSRLEEERRAIARELHDELGQCVTAIKTIGTAIATRAGDASPEVRDNARTVVSVASHIYDVMHSIIRRLRPSGLDDLGLADTLRDAVSTWSRSHPDVEWDLTLSGELEGLGEAVNITVYRIVQEALTNIVRHAAATRASVAVSRQYAGPDREAIIVCIQDDGKGLAQAHGNDRLGLAGMRERVQALDGKFEISGAPGQGVRVRAVIPLARAERGEQLQA
jgi:two-component system sensor histidine kinase UhpB